MGRVFRSGLGPYPRYMSSSAVVGAEAKVDGGGRARVLGRRKVEDKTKRHGGE